ncbi:MAG: cobalamin biosynthesis protein [Alphaproteobacteria bacterium]|nr:cobalamin biosynthesis protein [Alphaproteobacteria bacterium]
MDRAAILLLAQIADAVIGDPDALWRRVSHPVVWIGRIVAALDRSWNREADAPSSRRLWGIGALVLLLLAAAGVGVLITGLAHRLGAVGWVIELGVVAIFLAQRSLHQHVAAVAEGLSRDGLAGGRAAVAMIVGRDPDSLDEAGVCRAAIESAAENFSDGVVAPAFWYLIGGLPGLLAYKALNTADSMIGHRTDRHEAFGWASARLDDLANWAPARAAAGLVVLAAWFRDDADSQAAWRMARRDAAHHRSPNAGWPEAAFAGALGLRLAGPRRYGETMVEDAWMGDGRAEATGEDVRRALSLLITSCAVLAGVAALLTVLA